jgi:winged helix DNA-binding protein
MPSPVTLRALNRATLARQMLLAREPTTALRVIERLVALQAQLPRPPFLGIWSRAAGFRREHLVRLIEERKVVRATSLRGTLHLMTRRDYLGLRAALQPALSHGALAMLRTRARSIDVERLLDVARQFFEPGPRPFEELRTVLARRHPDADIRAMAYLVRLHLPLVQVPAKATWGYASSPHFALAESWLGAPLAPDAGRERLVLRYLTAFGPATPADVQTWSGLPLPLVREAFEALRPKLAALPGERGRELLDLPRAPRPDQDAGAPVRFLPEFDNLLLSHADRRRFMADAHRKAVFLPGLRVAATFLADGFVAGTWSIERRKDAATLTVQPFATLPQETRAALAREGETLARFIEADAPKLELRFAKPR